MSRRRIAIIALLSAVGCLGFALALAPAVQPGSVPAAYGLAGAPLLAVSAVMVGYAVGRRTRRGITHLAEQLTRMAASGEVGELPEGGRAEMKKLNEALNHLLRDARGRLDSQLLALREEQIRTRILQADKQQMEAVLNSIADAVIVTNAFGDLVLANGAAEAALNFRYNKDDRKNLSELVSDEALLAALDQLRRSEHRAPRKVVEFVHQSNGDTRIFKATVTAVRSKIGDKEELAGLVSVLHDVTREREVARMKNEFVSKVTHELKTPLSSIRAYVEMLVDGEAQDPQTRQEFYKIIDSESERLNRMIENMLNISRIEAGVIKVQKQELALTGIIKEVVDCLQPQAHEKDLVLEAELSPVFYQVHADRDMLYQAIMNLVSNSVKYTPKGGAIRVSSALENGMAMVRVSDTGLGIPAEDLPHLFEKFYRVSANKKAAKGTGLGLALVKEIVETLHHGQVVVESTVGKGTTFTVRLPVAE